MNPISAKAAMRSAATDLSASAEQFYTALNGRLDAAPSQSGHGLTTAAIIALVVAIVP